MEPDVDGTLVLLEEDLRAYVADLANGLYRKAVADSYGVARHVAVLLVGSVDPPSFREVAQALSADFVSTGRLTAEVVQELTALHDARQTATFRGSVPVEREAALEAGCRADSFVRTVLPLVGEAVKTAQGWPAVQQALFGFRILLGRPQD